MNPIIRPLGRRPYEELLAEMIRFTNSRTPHTPDEIWLVEHPPVYTLGLKTDPAHLPDTACGIPVIQTDRGGQITYHGPGQLVLYPLLDLKRLGLSVRQLVHGLEESLIRLLADFGIEAHARADAPGVYVEGAKIASLGLKVRRGCSYHGAALNWCMDLEPFKRINPCGLQNQPMTQLCDLVECPAQETLWRAWLAHLEAVLDLPVCRWLT